MVGEKRKKLAVGRARMLDRAPADVSETAEHPPLAPRGQKRAQAAWHCGVTQVATASDFWYGSQCHEEHASWQWGRAMVALASAIARPSLLTWPLLERERQRAHAPGHKKSVVPSLTLKRWPTSPLGNTQLPQRIQHNSRGEQQPGRRCQGLQAQCAIPACGVGVIPRRG